MLSMAKSMMASNPTTSRTPSIALDVAYVTDESVLNDQTLDFGKCQYSAVCIAARASASTLS